VQFHDSNTTEKITKTVERLLVAEIAVQATRGQRQLCPSTLYTPATHLVRPITVIPWEFRRILRSD